MNGYFRKLADSMEIVKRLRGKERLEYLWTYYKHWLLIAMFVILGIHTVCTMIHNSTLEHMLTIALVDTNVTKTQEVEILETELKEYLGYQEKNQVVTIDTSAYSRETDENVAKLAVVLSVVSDTDAVICNQEVYDRYAPQGIFVDWKELLGDDYEAYEKYMRNGVIDLALAENWTAKGYTSTENCYFCVLTKSEHQQEIKQVLKYLIFEN